MAFLALFDLDNTLVDRQATFRRWAESFTADRDLDAAAVDWLCEADNDGFANRLDVFSEACRQFRLTEDPQALVSGYWTSYVACYRPDETVVSSLERLRQAGWGVGIVTNGGSSQHEKVARSGLGDLVDACCVSEEIGAAKPDPKIFSEALLRCGHTGAPGEVWMVGDTPEADIAGGRQSGFRTAWMHRGREWQSGDYRPDAEVGSVFEAVELILRW
jgi:HAD superfamily hydrolase (TIGR01549 family)